MTPHYSKTKHTSKILIGSVLAAVTMAGTSGGVAVAASLNETPTNNNTGAQDTHSSDSKGGAHKSTYRATIFLTTQGNLTPVTIDSDTTTVNEAIAASGHNLADYRTIDGNKVDGNRTLTNGEHLALLQAETSTATSENISIPAPETTKESPDLLVGETKVESEGKAGQAIKTVVTTKDEKTGKTTSKESLAVTAAPQAKVTLIGTKKPSTDNTETTSTSDTNMGAQYIGRHVANPSSSDSNSNAATAKAVASNLADGAKAAEIAKAQVGKPYVWGSAGPNAFDCSGLIYYAFGTQLGYNIPRTASDIGHSSTPISKSDLQVGDILYTETHIGIYVGNGQVVHAATENTGVVYDSINGYFSSFQAGRLTR